MPSKSTSAPTPTQILHQLEQLSGLTGEDHRVALERLPREQANHYARLCSVNRRPAVVGTTGGHCGACHMRVPPQIMLVLSRGEQVCRCPSCLRFLTPPPVTPAVEPVGRV